MDGDQKFRLAVTSEGQLSTGAHETDERMVMPRTLTRGLPYVLIPTGDGYGRFMAVPF